MHPMCAVALSPPGERRDAARDAICEARLPLRPAFSKSSQSLLKVFGSIYILVTYVYMYKGVYVYMSVCRVFSKSFEEPIHGRRFVLPAAAQEGPQRAQRDAAPPHRDARERHRGAVRRG